MTGFSAAGGGVSRCLQAKGHVESGLPADLRDPRSGGPGGRFFRGAWRHFCGPRGLVCVVPNALFALRMKALSSRSGGPGTAMAFVVGEFFKIVAIVGLLVLIGLGYPDLHWGALFIGLILALKANLFAFLVKT
ncbi:ATP synthase subunit I [Pseudazoarcus pumilus]|uniref:ATP synthase subunit I n=1 Tax=Pseudazoarcus pumilus TaxID=2067960 RepID=UPI002FCDB4DD